MRLDALNAMTPGGAEEALLRCCGSRRWAREMAALRPFANAAAMFEAGDTIWRGLDAGDWRQAFAAHPRIGEPAAGWSAQEQAGASGAAVGVRARLADANREYESRFGHTFIVCASGRTADEMLSDLEQRLGNSLPAELHIAAEEQRRITRLRLERLLAEDG
jgi:OHCU decarboxylase